MADPITVCTDRVLPLEQAFQAAGRAISENPANVPVAIVRPLLGVVEPTPAELALITGKKWQNGRSLRVRFLGGANALQTRVENVSREWSQYANINLQFGTDPNAEIRISSGWKRTPVVRSKSGSAWWTACKRVSVGTE